jgi:purine-nucleoside phosphorylase
MPEDQVQNPHRGDEQVEDACRYIRRSVPFTVKTGIILGSGLGGVCRAFETVGEFSYRLIPHFPVSTVKGHRGRLVVGKRGRLKAFIMDGRVHRYEGYPIDRVTFPVSVLHRLGVSTMVITNAAGAVSPRLLPGDIMLIQDHLDLMWETASEVASGPQVWRRPYYSKCLLDLALGLGRNLGIPVKKGVLLATTGPSYETRAEVEFARQVGADAATMSTIPEVMRCHQLGMAVLGMSLITNVAASHQASHEEVIVSAARGSNDLQRLILAVVDAL